jgi:hypothetical protein
MKKLLVTGLLFAASTASYSKDGANYEEKLIGQYKDCYTVVKKEPDYSITLEKTGECAPSAITIFGIDSNNFQYLLTASVPPIEKGVRMKYAPALSTDKQIMKRLIIATYGDEAKNR